MNKLKKMFGFGLVLMTLVMGAGVAQAYDNEVYWANDRYCWKVNGVEQGRSTDYASAIQACIDAAPWSWIDITCRGNLSTTVNLNDGTGLNFHGNTVGIWHDEQNGFYARGRSYCSIINVILDGGNNWFVIHITDCDNSWFSNVTVQNNGGTGIRQDSHPSRPYEDYWDTGLTINECNFYNLGSHGIETYGIIDANVQNIVAVDCGGCGVCPNKMVDSYINNIDATRCCVGGGYAGLRLVNDCNNVHVGYLKAIGCGRGFVSGRSFNVTVDEVYIRDSVVGDDILITLESANIGIKSGTYNKEAIIHYTAGSGNYVNAVKVTDSSVPTGWVQLRNRGTGMYIDGYGRTANGSEVAQYANTTHYNAQWTFQSAGGGYYYIVNRGTGLKIDGYGKTTNGEKVYQYSSSTTHPNAQWSVQQTGSYYYLINRGTGMKIDGYGLTGNGDACRQYSPTTHVNAQWSIQ